MSQTRPCVECHEPESSHACVMKYIRPWLPSQVPRCGLAIQIRTCMGTFKTLELVPSGLLPSIYVSRQALYKAGGHTRSHVYYMYYQFLSVYTLLYILVLIAKYRQKKNYILQNVSCMNVCEGTDNDSQLDQKYVAVNKIIKAAAVCGGCDTHVYACDLATVEIYGPKA
jgi:hypothetical protein